MNLPPERKAELNFSIADIDSNGLRIISWTDHGCRPAMDTEIALWDAYRANQQEIAELTAEKERAIDVAIRQRERWKKAEQEVKTVKKNHRTGTEFAIRIHDKQQEEIAALTAEAKRLRNIIHDIMICHYACENCIVECCTRLKSKEALNEREEA